MLFRGSICTIAALLASLATVQAFDDAKYPTFAGLWRAVNLGVGGQAAFDPTKPWGRGQQAPLTPEYQAVHEASLADLSAERLLMPTRKGQPPDLRYFQNAQKQLQ
jgi:hypothetical protein